MKIKHDFFSGGAVLGARERDRERLREHVKEKLKIVSRSCKKSAVMRRARSDAHLMSFLIHQDGDNA